MESHQLLKNQEGEGRLEVQPPKQRRFRIVKLEERIAPKGGRITRLGYTCGGCDTSVAFCGETTLCGGTTHPPGHCK